MKTLIVTGGSRGIGAATAKLAAQRGYAVCVNYLQDRAAAEEVAGAIQSAGGNAIAVQADIGVESDVVAMFERVDRELGGLKALVNNAATLERQMRLEQMDAARMQRMFSTNAIGTMLCAREAVRRMSTKHGGSGGAIVNVSSGAARLGIAGRVCRLRGDEGSDRYVHGGTGGGSCRAKGFG